MSDGSCSVDACMDICDRACTATDCPAGALIDETTDPFSPQQFNVLKAFTISMAVLSVFGSAFIMYTYHLIQSHRPVALHIVYWLSASDLVLSFVYIIDGATTANEADSPRCPSGLCVLFAVFGQFFSLAAVSWNTFIAVNMHLTVLLTARIVKEEAKYKRRLHACAWSASLLTTLIAGAAGGLGRRTHGPARPARPQSTA